jgi:iron complex outermembrane receptor protein
MKAVISVAALATAMLAAMPVAAQAQDATSAGAPQAADTGSDKGEIVVTAQKRTERLMNVPISITALSGAAINETGAKNLVELQGVAPGLYLSGNTGYSVTPIAIRGVSGTGNALGDEPVAVYVDGMFQNAQTVSISDFLDIGGIEVVRGPQGTLQGRNSTAGALLIRTQDPKPEFGGYVRASVSKPTEYRAQAAITGPLSDTLTARFAIGAVDELGWAHNTFTGTRAGGQNSTSLRGILLWQPDSIRIRLSAGYSETTSSVAIQRFAQTIVNPTGQAVILGVNATPKTPLSPAQRHSILNDYNTPLNVIPRADTKVPYATLEASFDLGGVELVSISGYSNLKLDGQSDSDGLALTDRQGYNANHQRLSTLSQEVRLQSTGDGAFSWIIGGYATHIIGKQNIRLYNLTFSTGRNQYLHSIAHQVNDAFAPFADATYKFTDTLSVTGGVRYTYETKDFRRTSGFYNPANDTLYPAPPFSAYNPPKAKFDDVSYRGKLVFAPNRDALMYASYSKGFKSGGFNALGNDPAFEPETLTSAEIGAKVSLFDRHLSLTGSAYHNIYDNLQVTAGVPAGGVAVYNAAKARINGGEVEARFRSGNLTIDANVAYTDAKYTSFPNAQGVLGNIVNATGNTLARAPRWSYYVAPALSFTLGDDWTGQAQASWRWRSRIFFFATDHDAETLQSGGFGEAGMRVSVTKPSLGLTVALFGTNLNNARAVTNEQSLFNYPVASFNKPRSFGIQFDKSF